jgi:hypothetical protein
MADESRKSSGSEGGKDHDVQRMASAIEDLLYMEVIRFRDAEGLQGAGDEAVLTPQFALVVSNVMSNMNLKLEKNEDVMKSMYFSLLIYMNEYLKIPKSFTMAFGNDIEKHRENMECGDLISNYVTVLQNIFSRGKAN